MVPELYGVMLDWVRVDSLGGIPLIGVKRSNIVGLNAVIKRGFDVVVSALLLLLLGGPMLLIALVISLTSSGPALFLQKRIGKDGRRFTFLKFRSMYHRSRRGLHERYATQWVRGEGQAAPEEECKKVYKLTSDPRVTPVGRFLRKFSLDELPQLINVLRGDMSLVGPRPPLPYEMAEYKEWHRRRLEVRPGITGLWQVSGRNRLSFEQMVKLDIWYIENWSLWLDVKIIFKTVLVVLKGGGY
jgi:exopolysaccharide biosynthesis polyprenyl glycosylphosphotransferase